ncbi:RNA polymerase sigma factor [Actinoplanes sp. Pm04-4]|uniref:RNA polymerase sigma factor n=1 Tax=Paractinoplanes pyxinae TaxID=2997416 RepID=A0ABT4B5Y8_9ACTN|nr:DUF6596 domain-containing protein [Actinoplanes pyxinae]MCY1141045.1 RNA polymerase sigma factor [Actinoplanes pyxinae]
MTAVEAAFREHRGPLLATLVAELRSFDLAEDALQDAFAAATRQWPGEGVPRRPAAWLLSVARRRAIDRRRRDETLRRYLPLLITPEEAPPLLPAGSPHPWPSEGAPDAREGLAGEERKRAAVAHESVPVERREAASDGKRKEVAGALDGEADSRKRVAAGKRERAADAREGVAAEERKRAAVAHESVPVERCEAASDGKRNGASDGKRKKASAPDDSLQLLFACCHPALGLEAQVALTLRFVAGLTVPEIARLFLVSEPTMAARITRAKRKIQTAGIPLAVPRAAELPERAAGAAAVIYLLFTEGYRSYRDEVAFEAIRIGRLLRDLMPDDAEVAGLLALMLLQHSRRHARRRDGRLVLLADQDRTQWDAVEIAEALTLLEPPAPAGPYRLQALIAAQHSVAQQTDNTDWPAIVVLYERLEKLSGSLIVRLNRAVAIAQTDGPAAALALLDFDLPGNHQLPAARAEMLLRLDRRAEAAAEFERAGKLAPTDTERDHLRRRRESASGTGTGRSPVPVPAAEHPYGRAIRARCVPEPRRDVRSLCECRT